MARLCFLIVIAFVARTFNGYCQHPSEKPAGIKFTEGKWETVMAMARQQHKKIFVDAYATWCAPCKQLKETTFKNAQVAAYFNQQFINVTIDVEKGEGLVLADKYEISAYPTLLFLDENGRLIKRWEGFVDPIELLAIAKNENK